MSVAAEDVILMPCYPAGGRFDTDDDAIDAVDAFAEDEGYGVVVERSHKDARGRKFRVILACDRHGTLRNTRKLTETTRKEKYARSRKCGCPMRVHLRADHTGKWSVEHTGVEETHNHLPSTDPASHPTRRRRSRKVDVVSMINAGAAHNERAAVTIARIRHDKPTAHVIARDVYNERQKARTTALGPRTAIEHYIHTISDTNTYFAAYDVDQEEIRLRLGGNKSAKTV
jgi:hypothetical protein